MRLTIVILLASLMQVSAGSFAQKVNLVQKNVKLGTVFKELRKQTGYDFFYQANAVDASQSVDVHLLNVDITEALMILFRDLPLKYSIDDKIVMISKKEPSVLDKAKAAFLNLMEEITVTGRVVDNAGQPLVGANVRVKAGDKVIKTNSDGRFRLTGVDEKAVLEITYIGYQRQEIKAAENVGTITLTAESLVLNEVDVISTGYSTKKIGELTGSVQRISGDELRKGLTTSDPVSLLKGKVAGLYISEQGVGDPTSSGGQIFVRGQSSMAGVGVDQFNEVAMPALNYGPLLVLDGVIMPNQNLKDLVTPQEIENIVILKDAAATAVYGSRAAGGVLVVTTKKGGSGQPRVNLEVKYGFNKPNQGTLRYLSGQELFDLQKEYFTQDYGINQAGLVTTYPTLQSYLDYRLPSKADVDNSYDWSKYAFVNSHSKEMTASVTGGNENTKYYVGVGYYNEESTGVNNNLVRKNFRINLDSRLSDRLKATVSINGILNDGNRDNFGATQSLADLIPWANPYGADGLLLPFLSSKLNGSVVDGDNPLYNRQFDEYKTSSQLLFGSARLEYKIFDWLNLSSTNSGTLNYSKVKRYWDARTYYGSAYPYSSKGALSNTNNQLMSYLTSNQLTMQKEFGDHALSAIAAMEFGKTSNENSLINVNHVKPGYPQISAATSVGGSYDFSIYGIPTTKAGNIEGGQDIRAVYSLFGELGYTYKRRFSLSGSLRSDASSSFGRDKRYGTFFSGGAAWIISEERFIKKLPAISNLKLRANYGTSGSQLGDNFLTRTLYAPTTNGTYGGQNAFTIVVLGNPDLQWEVTQTLSTGIDIGLFGRVNASIDFYNRRSNDLLQKVELPYLAGFPSQWRNVGSLNNKGIELLINSENIRGKRFSWSTSFNFSYNKNEIIGLAIDSLSQGFGNSFSLYKGDDINTLKAIKYAGVDPQTGQPRFEKLIFNEQGVRTGVAYVNTPNEVGANLDRRQYQTIGSFQPKYYGGITNDFTYGRFSLNFMITFAQDYVMTDAWAESYQGRRVNGTQQIAFRDGDVLWTTPGQTNATQPQLYYNSNLDYRGTSKYIHDASNIALRTARLSYKLPAPLLKRAKMSNCMIYISGDNLYTWYSKGLVAPSAEGPSVGQAQDFGRSSGGLGIPRRYILGLQLTF